MKRTLVIAATLTLLFAGLPAFAQEISRDDVIAADVNRVIGNHSQYTVYDVVGIEVKDGVVTLTGNVTQPYKKNSFEKRVREEVVGVTDVVNKISVLPPSYNDDRLRYLLARSIYNDSRLLRYSLERWPYPIHIIVRNGHVTFEGEVSTMMDKRIIQSKASDIIGVVSVTNNLKVS